MDPRIFSQPTAAARRTLFLAVLSLAFAAAAEARPNESPDGTVAMDSPGFRGLMIKTDKPGCYVPAPLLATEVHIEVTGPIARTRVRQHYLNPAKGWIEGVYVFPLADKSAVDGLRMRIGERIVEGVIKEKAEARRVYQRAKAEGRRAALLESHRPNVFMSNVANIGPGENITIEIAYQKTVPARDGEYRLRFPMVVGHRYFPKGSGSLFLTGGKPSEGGETETVRGTVDGSARDIAGMTSPVPRPEHGKINPVRLTVRINGGADLAGVKSHHHRITDAKGEDGALSVKLADGPIPADRDFELTWPAGRGASTAMLFTEEWQGRHYGLVMLAPPGNRTREVIAEGREIVFVLDTSGSMGGNSIRQAKASLQIALAQLTPADKFNIIQFNSHTDALLDRVRPATPRNTMIAQAYLSRLKAQGGTEMRPALFAALDGGTRHARLRQVVFMTDGAVGNERQLFGTIARRLGDARLYTVGIGSAPNRYFMRGAARRGRGTFTFVGSPNQVQTRMTALWRKLAKPVVTHIAVTPETASRAETWPAPLPDLFAGEPVYAAIRFDGAPGDVTVTGKGAAGPWRKRLSFTGARKGTGIAKLWAREKIAGLQTLQYEDVTADEIRKRTIAVALTHGLVTRHTSLVAVDKVRVREGSQPLHSRKLPLNLPDGWDYDKVFGTGGGAGSVAPRKAMLDRARQRFKAASVAVRPAPAGQAAVRGQGDTANLHLPQTATPQTLYLMVGGLSLAAALALILLGRARKFDG